MTREEYIKQLITLNGYTIKDFAQSINIPYTTLLSMLNKDKLGKASVDTVIKICDSLDITIENLQSVLTENKAPEKLVLSDREKRLILYYRKKQDLQKAVDILLSSGEAE